jgi:two-component system probable response regulator PhcQ
MIDKKEFFSVLFVDDEVNVLNALRRSLRKEPYATHFAQGPEEAMEVLKSNDIDLIVSDHLMPGMDGLSFLKLVKNLFPEVIRVVLTGHAELQLAIEAINEGEVFRFLTKPWNDLELRVMLKNICDFKELRRDNQMLQFTLKKQQQLIEKMESEHPGIFDVQRDETGAIVLEDEFDGR